MESVKREDPSVRERLTPFHTTLPHNRTLFYSLDIEESSSPRFDLLDKIAININDQHQPPPSPRVVRGKTYHGALVDRVEAHHRDVELDPGGFT